jgi:hypothetical protein
MLIQQARMDPDVREGRQGESGGAHMLLETLADEPLAVSVHVACELYVGAELADPPSRTRRVVASSCSRPSSSSSVSPGSFRPRACTATAITWSSSFRRDGRPSLERVAAALDVSPRTIEDVAFLLGYAEPNGTSPYPPTATGPNPCHKGHLNARSGNCSTGPTARRGRPHPVGSTGGRGPCLRLRRSSFHCDSARCPSA